MWAFRCQDEWTPWVFVRRLNKPLAHTKKRESSPWHWQIKKCYIRISAPFSLEYERLHGVSTTYGMYTKLENFHTCSLHS